MTCSWATAPAEQVILPTEIEHLWLLPGSKNLTGANIELAGAEDRAIRLRQALEPVKDNYDLIVLDCPPALDLLTLNVLVAADSLIVPMQAEYFALEGISELISTLERVRAAFNPEITIEGVLLTMYDDRTNLAQQVTETLREYFRERLFRTVIPRNIRLAEAPSHGKPVALYDARSRGTEAYFELAGEFLARNQIESPRAAARKAAEADPAQARGSVLALLLTGDARIGSFRMQFEVSRPPADWPGQKGFSNEYRLPLLPIRNAAPWARASILCCRGCTLPLRPFLPPWRRRGASRARFRSTRSTATRSRRGRR